MLQAHMVCHTHWDREWYKTRMEFRPQLVRLVDNLLDVLETSPDFTSFMLDGQTIALEDYLEVRPYHRDRLASAVRAGRLFIGPWYILPDEQLVSGESHIRNFLIGRQVASAFGEPMHVGYLPDSFGHPEQMPQILAGLGMDTALFWRGASHEMEKTEFFWVAPDGYSTVLCIHMAHGYGTAAGLRSPSDDTLRRLRTMIGALHEKSSVDSVLLMNGSDHILPEPCVPAVVEAFNRSQDDCRLLLSTIPDFVRSVRASLPDGCKTFSGQFCYGDRSLLLGGTLSTRMPLKMKNFRVQSTMERVLEPLICLEKMNGGVFDFSGYQTLLWKYILRNHAHDSICGCSIDAVHEEMETRFGCLEQLQRQLLLDTWTRMQCPAPSDADAELLLFEPTQDRLPCYWECDVDFDTRLLSSVDFSTSTIVGHDATLPPAPEGIAIKDENDRDIPAVLLSVSTGETTRYDDFDLPRVYRSTRARIGLYLPGFDYGVHVLRLSRTAAAQLPVAEKPSCIENEFYHISYRAGDAGLTVTDKKSGRTHEGVHAFVDMGDAGDEYTYSWPTHDSVFGLDLKEAPQVTVTHAPGGFSATLTWKGALLLPRSLADDRLARRVETVSCPFITTVTLTKDVDRVDFDTCFDNRVQDHRLQVSFPVGTTCVHSSGSSAFSVTEHPVTRPVPDSWEEYPLPSALTHGFVDAGDGAYGLSLASCGMTEYEVQNHDGQSHIALTLLRCVGWLSRDDLNTRHGNGGWSLPTPGGQCPGVHHFSYSVTYHTGSWRQADTYAQAERRLHPVRLHQLTGTLSSPQNPLAFVSQLPPLVRLSACKPSETGRSIVVRLYSLADEETQLRLPLPSCVTEAHRVSLREERLERLVAADRQLAVTVGAREIVSVELVLRAVKDKAI